jgi:hypothetical protein
VRAGVAVFNEEAQAQQGFAEPSVTDPDIPACHRIQELALERAQLG